MPQLLHLKAQAIQNFPALQFIAFAVIPFYYSLKIDYNVCYQHSLPDCPSGFALAILLF